MKRLWGVWVLAMALTVEACTGGEDPPSSPGPTTASTPAGGGQANATLLAGGDLADCQSEGDEATAAILDNHPEAAVATLGDNVYPRGTAEEFTQCYQPSWGRHRPRTHPAPGNHDYGTSGAAGYFGYFGPAAGDPRFGYYSYDLGAWHVISLNSNCGPVACGRGSAQLAWLEADLAAHRNRCTLAYWHHPRFSSGRHGSTPAMAPLFEALYDHGADVVLAGHDHSYERLAPLDPGGDVDTEGGVRSFVVGTGGRSHYEFGKPITGSEVRHSGTFGVLKLDLRPDGYDWRFLPEAGRSFTDSGSGTCH